LNVVHFITGKSGVGKTTLAYRMAYEMAQRGVRVIVLDGARFRKWFPSDFTDEGRQRNVEMVATFAAMLEEQGYTVIVELFAPTRALRMAARRKWAQSQLVYLPGGTVWGGTTYEEPTTEEFVEMFRNTPSGAPCTA